MHGKEIRLFLYLSFAPLLSLKEGALIRIVQLYVVNTSYLSCVLIVHVVFVFFFLAYLAGCLLRQRVYAAFFATNIRPFLNDSAPPVARRRQQLSEQWERAKNALCD